MAHDHALRLTGLDALDPLAFLASLGCLLAATEHAETHERPRPKLRFDLGGRVLPILHSDYPDSDAVVAALVTDLDTVAGRTESGERDPFLAFTYPDENGVPVADLKPPVDAFRSFGERLLGLGPSRRSLDWAAATLTDVALDGSGQAAKPFALHFTAGQQRFLAVANELLDGCDSTSRAGSPKRAVDETDIRSALFGPWPNDRALKVFSWSPAQERSYALRATDPSSDKKLGTPGADWLALRGIGLLSSAPVLSHAREQIATSGVRGRWKNGTFTYPVWPMPLDVDAVRSLLRHPEVVSSRKEAPARGVRTLPRGVELLSCRITRSDQGGYGAFSRPSRH